MKNGLPSINFPFWQQATLSAMAGLSVQPNFAEAPDELAKQAVQIGRAVHDRQIREEEIAVAERQSALCNTN